MYLYVCLDILKYRCVGILYYIQVSMYMSTLNPKLSILSGYLDLPLSKCSLGLEALMLRIPNDSSGLRRFRV